VIEVASADERPLHPLAGDVVQELDTGRRVTFTGQAWRYLDRPVIRKVSFEHVSAIAHPEYYHGNNPCPDIDPADIPDEHWTRTERQGDDVDKQYRGLIELKGRGELIRNVILYESEAPVDPQWREVATGT
jgi:hypothetical protein